MSLLDLQKKPSSPGRSALSKPTLSPKDQRHSKRQHISKPKIPSRYIEGLTTWERVDLVLHELDEKHKWSITTFIHALVTAEPEKPYGVSCSKRAESLSKAIFNQPEVTERLFEGLRGCNSNSRQLSTYCMNTERAWYGWSIGIRTWPLWSRGGYNETANTYLIQACWARGSWALQLPYQFYKPPPNRQSQRRLYDI